MLRGVFLLVAVFGITFLMDILTKLCRCLIRESPKFQVRHATVVVDYKHGRVAFLECDKVPLLIFWVTKKFETVLNELFNWREWRESLSTLF